MRVSVIVAVARNGTIGRDNALPWRIPEDLARFRRLTWGHALVMGRRTFESIGRALPGRRTIVVTAQPGYTAPDATVAHSLPEALAAAARDGADEVFIAGGSGLFREALPLMDRIYLTLIDADVEGDTFFPELDRTGFCVVEETPLRGAASGLPYRFLTLDRGARH